MRQEHTVAKTFGKQGMGGELRADIEATGCDDTQRIYRAQNAVYGRLLCTRQLTFDRELLD